MPNNQDTMLKPCPFCGGGEADFHKDAWGVWCPDCDGSVICHPEKTRYEEDVIKAWNIRAPTPREQELEAQNKALWELVGNGELALNWFACRSEAGSAARHIALDAIAAIQKAKEAKEAKLIEVMAIKPQQKGSE